MSHCINRYRKYVDHFDLSEHQKIELIHTVGRMMESFVERAFGDDATQQCIEGHVVENALVAGDVIPSEHSAVHSNQLLKVFNGQKGKS